MVKFDEYDLQLIHDPIQQIASRRETQVTSGNLLYIEKFSTDKFNKFYQREKYELQVGFLEISVFCIKSVKHVRRQGQAIKFLFQMNSVYQI